jgi:hypothetical protein
MNFLFGKKEMTSALAEVLVDGRALGNQELTKPKYRNYSGPEIKISLAVRILPENEPPFEAQMKVGVQHAFLLKQGVRVQVKYEARKKAQVEYDDNSQAVLDRNPQLKKSG